MIISIEEKEYNKLIQDRYILDILLLKFSTEQRLIINKWRDNEATLNEIRKLFGLSEVM